MSTTVRFPKTEEKYVLTISETITHYTITATEYVLSANLLLRSSYLLLMVVNMSWHLPMARNSLDLRMITEFLFQCIGVF